MANSAQARKRARQAEKHRQRNASQRSMMRTKVKRVFNALEAGDREAAEAAFREAIPVLDKMARKGLVHKNKAARYKSRFAARIQAL
ncbi:MAG: 30S ribosomal protein S20 [Gammaproteobacteria bacterium]|nr:MAG: 30S ribosomal protein S20 [Gammaproteobacteria bacterium]